jgi:adenine-specific DNA methylase
MSSQASFTLRNRNPDVLSCIANLSNDEVFTPPELANRMLDDIAAAWADRHDGANIWADPTVRFLDPCTKSGVFLREITRRLTDGLKSHFPDLQQRVDHILTKQVFGIGITKLTSLLARRSVYCSKYATGKHSITKSFPSEAGNIWYERVEHTWVNGRCTFCGASKKNLDRSDFNENYAYAFIHDANASNLIVKIFGEEMNFDVIIGNPPYQLKDASGSASATPIYNKFIEQAIALDAKLICMIVPSRWFSGGKGLDSFRTRMLHDKRFREIVDYIIDRDAFPNINTNGGINYFVWDKNHNGECFITTIEPGGEKGEKLLRSLDEFNVFVRRNESLSILRKVLAKGFKPFSQNVLSRKPFGLPTDYFGKNTPSEINNIKLHSSGKVTWISRNSVLTNNHLIDKWKVLIGRATDGNEKYPLPVWDTKGPLISGPGEACTETYLVAYVTDSQIQAENIAQYMRTRFFRFLVSLRKITQDNKSDVFLFVPNLYDKTLYTDEVLSEVFELNDNEINHIKKMVRDMSFTG